MVNFLNAEYAEQRIIAELFKHLNHGKKKRNTKFNNASGTQVMKNSRKYFTTKITEKSREKQNLRMHQERGIH